MKQSRSCYTCQRHFHNLMSATCGHKICFHCVKSNRNNKCIECTTLPQPKARHLLSPAKTLDPKEPSTKFKDSESKLLSEPSRAQQHRRSLQRSQLHPEDEALPALKCHEHHQPLTMYSKSGRDLICSVCVCSKTKLNGDVVPLRMAEEHLKKQNRLNKEEARVILSNIEHAQRIMTKNTEIFENSYKSGLRALEGIFEEMRAQVEGVQHRLKEEFMCFFQRKFKECSQISQDLSYLSSILKEYKQNNKEHLSFNELVYTFTSFKLIRGTVKHLDLDYIPYLKDVSVVQTSKQHYTPPIRDFVKLKLNLPLKFAEGRLKSRSNKSASRSKNEEWEEVQRGGHTAKLTQNQRDRLTQNQRASLSKKHQMSLCSNVHGIQFGEQQKNLYKMLLKTKFKL